MRARLILISGAGTSDTPASYDLTPEQAVTLGRSRDNTVVLHDEHASRLHAKIYFAEGGWHLRDFGLNGTRVEGERVQQQTELEHGQEIRIGDTRLQFRLADAAGNNSTPRPFPLKAIARPADPPVTTSTTRLQLDELTALCQFMAAAVEEQVPPPLIRRALQLVLTQTGASVAGFLNLDPGDPLPKLVLPENASVDVQLSRQLTRRVQRDNKMVWLGADLADTQPGGSLARLNDALCVPLRTRDATLGAIHVYKTDSYFTEREARFCEVLAGYLASHLHVLRERRKLEAENSRIRGRLPAGDDLVGDSPSLLQLRQMIARAAPQPFTVLIHGESGVGKELIALALHRQSQRAEGPLVVVNCAAITPTLMESELFGYVKNAFTGAARDYPGMFQQADEGTLFLDEVGELSPECQAKLLRVIEGKCFRPIGSTVTVKTDVRIVAATHRNLEQEVKAGRFREDLYFRLKVIQIEVPPLREHASDVRLLVPYFLDRLNLECRRQVKLTEAAIGKLMAYSWPGNVRQLRAVLESTVVMSENDTIDADDLLLPVSGGCASAAHGSTLKLEDLEVWAIKQAMKQTNGNITQAAKLLGVVRDTLASKLRKYQIEWQEE